MAPAPTSGVHLTPTRRIRDTAPGPEYTDAGLIVDTVDQPGLDPVGADE